MTAEIEQFTYDDAIVRKFTLMTFIWGVVGMLVGVIVALQLAAPVFNFELAFLSFGRLRPLHTNAVIFAFTGNAIFAGVYYSMQRLLKTPMYSKVLSNIHFWGWQAIIVAAAITLPLGMTQGKEYAELEWPIDIAIAVIWLVFAFNCFGTIAKRRERHIYVAIWFYIATLVTITLLHVFNNLVVPAGLWRSFPIYAGVQDAFMQWWYGHNAVGFLLTTPLLGMMYYFLPKAANRPVFSYRLSIIHFWSLVFIYIWAGPHHLHYTALPAWASTLGMLFSVMLWMPSWGGMLNGLLTLRGAWDKVATDPVLKFFVVAVTFYGMSTFEGPLSAALGQVGQPAVTLHRLDDRPCSLRGSRLGRIPRLRNDLLAAAAPLPDRAVEPQAGRGSLLARHHRHPALHRRDLRRRAYPGTDVARLRR
jgi:cytochrome c oxidase cbb3-type subunit I/II